MPPNNTVLEVLWVVGMTIATIVLSLIVIGLGATVIQLIDWVIYG